MSGIHNLLFFTIISILPFITKLARFPPLSPVKCFNGNTPNDWKHQLSGSKVSKPNDILNIYIVPHTHDDPGWLKTFNDYYFGIDMNTQQAGVQYILDTTVDELIKDKNKTFVYVEMSQFMKWWNEQTQEMKDAVKTLVQNKQLEFPLGGYCQSDEATPYYEDIIDQMTLGNQFLKNEFNYIPTYAWNIDNFGHSAAEPALLSQMGFTSFVVSRIDYQDKENRVNNKSMEINWIPQQKSGETNSIFLHVSQNHQSPPPGFGFDLNAGRSDPIVDDPENEGFNAEEKSGAQLFWFQMVSNVYKSPNTYFQMHGEDFSYVGAHEYFKNLDKLVKQIKDHPSYNLNVSYNLPSRQFEYLKEKGIDFPKKYDDFFPYASGSNDYWTGYFVSRIMKKYVVREYGRFMQIFRTLFCLIKLNGTMVTPLDNYLKIELQAEKAIALNLHHDGLTGTEKQKVANNYMDHLANATEKMNKILYDEASAITKNSINENVVQTQCKWNLTSKNCPVVYDSLINKKTILLSVYHPTIKGNYVIRLKVPISKLTIIDSSGNQVAGDVFCANTTDPSDCDLFFVANLEPQSFTFQKIFSNEKSNDLLLKPHPMLSLTKYGNIYDNLLTAPFNKTSTILLAKNSGKITLINSISKKNNAITFEIKYNYQKSYQGPGQNSGAYVFRPDKNCQNHSIPFNKFKSTLYYQGRVLNQLTMEGTNVTAHLRFYQNIEYLANIVEVESFINSIELQEPDEKELWGKEVTLNVITEIQNNKTFYTDSNGLELQQRILDYRPTWKLEVSEPSAGNYYPINAMIQIEDINTKKGMFILNDRSQGGSSLKEGEIEIMIHRRLIKDDGKGVGEPLNELDYDGKGLRAKMKHYIVFCEKGIENENPARTLQFYNDNKDILLLAQTDSQSFKQKPLDSDRILKNDFPQNLLLKTNLKMSKDNSFILRFSSLDSVNVINYTIDEATYTATEVSLTATQTKKEMIKNKRETSPVKLGNLDETNYPANGVVPIKQLQLRAFIIKKKL